MHGIKFCPDDLGRAIERLETLPLTDVLSLTAIEAQTLLEIELRKLVLSLPNDVIKPDKHETYLSYVRGDQAPSSVVEFLSRKHRTLRLGEDEIIDLERRQGGRCACCGTILTSAIQPHIDHVRPIMLGGDDDTSNMQILCEQCNLGKGALLHWVMAAPWFSIQTQITARSRYCTLARHRSRCSHAQCSNTAQTSELHVSLRIPRALGGRPVFDNLQVLCAVHHHQQLTAQEQQARDALRQITPKRKAPTMPLRRR